MPKIEPQLKVANDDGREAPSKTRFKYKWWRNVIVSYQAYENLKKKIVNKLSTIHLDEKNVKIIITDFKCLKK